jgi:hypothetical protein
VATSADDDEVGAVLLRTLLELEGRVAGAHPVASTAAFVAVELEKWIIRRRSRRSRRIPD